MQLVSRLDLNLKKYVRKPLALHYEPNNKFFSTRFTLERRPAFESYVKRLALREASIRAIELDDALLNERA